MKLKTINDLIVHRVNDGVIGLLGKRWNVVLVNEFPKCGGSWVRRMLSDYLGVELANGNNNDAGWLGVIRRNAVIQRHWLNRNFNVAKTILVIRDPRDVYNSFYFHETYFQPRKQFLDKYGYVAGDDDRENMYRYLKYKFANPENSIPGFLYSDWWRSYRNVSDVHIVKYEDLNADAEPEMKRMIEFLDAGPIDEERLKKGIDKYSFEKMAQRKKGVENKSSHARKGVVGDWRQQFSAETCALVKEHLNQLILDMQYEQSEDWS